MGSGGLRSSPWPGVGKTAGRDVQRERHQEMFAEAIRPLTGMEAKQLEVQGRRMRLSAEAQRECCALDVQIPEAEREEGRAAGERRELIKVNLFTLRQRHRGLRC